MDSYTLERTHRLFLVYSEASTLIGMKIMEKNHFVAVAGIVTSEENIVLLIKNPQRGWEFPGGMIEPGERG